MKDSKTERENDVCMIFQAKNHPGASVERKVILVFIGSLRFAIYCDSFCYSSQIFDFVPNFCIYTIEFFVLKRSP